MKKFVNEGATIKNVQLELKQKKSIIQQTLDILDFLSGTNPDIVSNVMAESLYTLVLDFDLSQDFDTSVALLDRNSFNKNYEFVANQKINRIIIKIKP